MNPRSLPNRRFPAVLASALLVLGLAACSVSAGGSDVAADRSGPAVTSGPASAGSMRILVRFGDRAVDGTLNDTAAARQFAAKLPLEVELRDPMGQAKSGLLSGGLDVVGADRTTDPAVGEIGYWEPSNTLAIFYDDLGQSLAGAGVGAARHHEPERVRARRSRQSGPSPGRIGRRHRRPDRGITMSQVSISSSRSIVIASHSDVLYAARGRMRRLLSAAARSKTAAAIARLMAQAGDEVVRVGDQGTEDSDGHRSADLAEGVEDRAGGAGLFGGYAVEDDAGHRWHGQ